MSDLISRQAAIDAVEFGITYAKAVNKETGEITELFKNSNKELRNAVKRIEALSSADVVDVVRCGACKHRDVEKGFCEGRGWPMQLVPDDGFCDKGKRWEQ